MFNCNLNEDRYYDQLLYRYLERGSEVFDSSVIIDNDDRKELEDEAGYEMCEMSEGELKELVREFEDCDIEIISAEWSEEDGSIKYSYTRAA